MKRFGALVLALLLAAAMTTSALAHSGRTDKNGGHKDNKNVSGLGSYHYHCGGNPPHLHSGGNCPYGSGQQAPRATQRPSTPKPAQTPKPTAKPTARPAQTSGPAAAQTARPAAGLQAQSDEYLYGKTNTKGVNVREEASVRSDRVGKLSKVGTPVVIVEVVITDANETWYMIQYEDGYAFVHGNLVDLVEWEAYARLMDAA